MTHQEAIQKAVKLLRLAQSDNAHEAASAAALAQEIIDRYKLGAMGLSADAPTDGPPAPEEPIMDLGSAPLESSAKLAAWKTRLAVVVATANQCKVYLSKGYRTTSIAIIGRPSDAETVRYLHAYLTREVDRLADRDGAGLGQTWRNNFRLGVIETVGAKLTEQRKATENDARAESFARGGESAIVRVNTAIAKLAARSAEVEQWAAKNLRLRATRSTYSRANPSARDAGRAAGREIRIGGAKAGLGSGRRAIGEGGQ